MNALILPSSGRLAARNFTKPRWNDFAGERGGFVANSLAGDVEAIAEPIAGGFRCWLVRTSDGETIHTEDLCVS